VTLVLASRGAVPLVLASRGAVTTPRGAVTTPRGAGNYSVLHVVRVTTPFSARCGSVLSRVARVCTQPRGAGLYSAAWCWSVL